MKRLLAGLTAAALLGAPAAQASNTVAGRVTFVHVMDNGVVLFNHTGTRTTQPACAISQGRWTFDASTPAGQAKLSLLLTAYSTKQPVVIYGKHACNVWGDTETVEYFHTMD